MQNTNDQIPASGILPDNYQEVLSWNVTGKPIRVVTLNTIPVNESVADGTFRAYVLKTRSKAGFFMKIANYAAINTANDDSMLDLRQTLAKNRSCGGVLEVFHKWKFHSRVLTLNILGIFLFVIFGVIFVNLAISLGKLPSKGEISGGLSEIVAVFVGIVLTLVLHELTHGLAMRMFGARPKYGILWKGMVAYATSPGYAYHRNSFVAIALAPFVFISILVVLGIWLVQGTLWVALLGICGVLNASGAIGDLWITLIVLRYAATALVIDERDGIRVFLPKPLDEKISYPADGLHPGSMKIKDA